MTSKKKSISWLCNPNRSTVTIAPRCIPWAHLGHMDPQTHANRRGQTQKVPAVFPRNEGRSSQTQTRAKRFVELENRREQSLRGGRFRLGSAEPRLQPANPSPTHSHRASWGTSKSMVCGRARIHEDDFMLISCIYNLPPAEDCMIVRCTAIDGRLQKVGQLPLNTGRVL